jgi:hypothetical protein
MVKPHLTCGAMEKGGTRREGAKTDIPTVYSISSEHIGHWHTCVVLIGNELKQLCFCLYSAKHQFSNETDTEYSNIMPNEASDMELVQPL